MRNSFCKADKMHAQGLRTMVLQELKCRVLEKAELHSSQTGKAHCPHFMDTGSRHSKFKTTVKANATEHSLKMNTA